MPDLVLFEVLRGFRHEQDFQAARRVLAALPVVEIGGEDGALRAAHHYRALRAAGVTVRSPIDVLLASFCIGASSQRSLPLRARMSPFDKALEPALVGESADLRISAVAHRPSPRPKRNLSG
jgi:hypothetical protein